MGPALELASIAATLLGGLAAGLMARKPTGTPAIPLATLAIAALIGVVFAAQLVRPELLQHLQRSESVWRELQAWRIFTALFAQDGGAAGFIFNLIILLVIGSVAESRLGSRLWLLIYFGAGVLTEIAALAWQPVGAGNSIAVFALAGALVASGAVSESSRVRLLIRAIAAAAASSLLLMRDIHGVGFLLGALLALAPSAARPPHPADPAPQRPKDC